MVRVPKIVPWTSTEEYMGVGDSLYSDDAGERRRGVAIVKAWRARGRVPVAVDATASLVDMLDADTSRAAGVTGTRLRHMYAMAMIRFVNSIVDLEQKGAYAQSMAALASRIGMPAWFVELRHACTHEQIPSLAVLRAACEQALGWLGDYYWKKQERVMPADTMDRVRGALLAYKAAYDATRVTEEQQQAEHAGAFNAARAALAELLGVMHADAVRLYVVPVLLEPGLLVPEDKRQRAKFPDCAMPAGWARQWGGLFRLLEETWGATLVFEELLGGIAAALAPECGDAGIFAAVDSAPSTSHAAMLVAWVRWILKKHYVPGGESTVSIGDLLEVCLRSPGYYSRAVLKAVSDADPTLKRELKPFVDYMGRALAALVAADAAEAKAGKGVAGFSEQTLQDEERLMQERLKEALGGAAEDEDENEAMDVDAAGAQPAAAQTASGRWAYVAQDAWVPCPIGALSDGSIPALELPAWLDDVPLHATSA
ncbi:rRNA-processing protein las1 [Coemansia sp. RSA 2705]|nr:rRNA-processing protein las1 [Coemansia sp. RSA 2705]